MLRSIRVCMYLDHLIRTQTARPVPQTNAREDQETINDNDAVGTPSPGQCTVLTDLLRTTHLLALLKAHLYSPAHHQKSLHILTLILGDNLDFLGARKTQALLAYRLRTLQIVYLETLPISIPALWVSPLATLKTCGYRIPYILTTSKRLRIS